MVILKRKLIRLLTMSTGMLGILVGTIFAYKIIYYVPSYTLRSHIFGSHLFFSSDRFFALDTLLNQKQNISLEAVTKEVLAHFPEIIGLEISRSHTLFARVTTQVIGLRCRVNDTTVLTQDTRLLPAVYFNPDIVNALPKIIIHEQTESSEFLNFITSIDQDLLDRFTFEWVNKTIIKVVSKMTGVSFLIRHDYIPSETHFLNAEKILNSIPNSIEDVKNIRVVDLRFDHQIIIRKGVWGDG